jgi:HEPN domain-containing protein
MNPPAKKSLLSSPQDWIAHAQSDLKMVKPGREDGEILFEQVCFHAQQAVEKALKAVLLARQVDFPLTHDLEVLLDIGQKAKIAFLGLGVMGFPMAGHFGQERS